MPERDEFSWDIGIKENYDGTISNETLFKQQDRGNWTLTLVIDADDGDRPTINLSVGGADKGWTSVNGGETLVNTFNKEAKYHVKSTIAQFINSAIDAGASEELKARSRELNNNGPYEAALWWGMRFHFDAVEEEQNRRDEKTGEWNPQKVQVTKPIKYLGMADQAAETSQSTDGIDEDDMRTLVILAAQHDDRGKFADAVMKTPGKDGDPMLRNKAIMAKLSDKAFWDTLKAG